jgi:hypothetical protein
MTNIGVVYYYCHFSHNQDETGPFLKWTINQLCRQADHVPTYLHTLFKNGKEPSLVELLLALEKILASFDCAYMIVDAIDESFPREDLLKIVRDLSTDQRFQKIRLLVTSREYFDIETTFSPISESVSMLNPLLHADIKAYIQSKLNGSNFRHWPQDLINDTIEALANGAKGM